jgi:AraC family transcriptional regulator of adaptative response / DNA-3-methyladenine glycosylase II
VALRLRGAFDLDADSAEIDRGLATLPLPAVEGGRLPGAFDGFETAVRIVLGQQVSVKAAVTLAARLVGHFGEPIATPWHGITHLFPTPATIADADASDIARLGIVGQRVRALQALAREVAAGRITLDRHAPLEPTLQALRDLPGFGEWTVQLTAMRVLGWPDAWPCGDLGLRTAMERAMGSRDTRVQRDHAQAWRPWRAYAVMRMWHHLETP